MVVKLFSVYDSKVENFSAPLPFSGKGDATRWFMEMAKKPDNNICKYPADFTLFELGSFDNLTGKFVLHSTPMSIGLALEFIASPLQEAISNG